MDYYGINSSSDFFAHYGVKGMKWGVRRLAGDASARPSKIYKALYSDKSNKSVSPRRLQRDFNNLDKSYMNIAAKKRAKEIEAHDLAVAKDLMNYNIEKAQKNNKLKKVAKYNKVKDKINKNMKNTIEKGINYVIQGRNIESMMDGIAAKAIGSGYTVKSKHVTRPRNVYTKTRGTQTIGISGSRIKVRKNGNGQVQFSMYKNGERKQVKFK